MMNPASMMKMMQASKVFQQNHPKFVAFLKYVFSSGIEEGTVIEITVRKPGQDAVTGNIQVMQSDLNLMDSLKDLQ